MTQLRQLVSDAVNAQRELRSTVGQFEIRRAAGDSLTLTGYASVVEAPYEMYGGPPYGWNETVDRHAFDKTLREKPDVQLLVNHGGIPLARTKSGTLRLSVDDTGLHVEAELEPKSANVSELAMAMDRGDIEEMSFAFRTIRQEWDEEYVDRRLLEVSIHRGDVSVVNYGASPTTSASLRAQSLLSMAGMEPDAILAEVRSIGVTDLTVLASVRDLLTRAITVPSAPPTLGVSIDEARQLLPTT